MSDNGAAAGRGGGGRGRGRYPQKRAYNPNTPRAFKSSVIGIEGDTFNTGHSKFASQFKTSRRNVANFVQRTLHDEGHLVARTIKTGTVQTIKDPDDLDSTLTGTQLSDAKLKRDVKVQAISKREVKLEEALKRGFAVVYDQCSEAVKSRLETTDDWTNIECDQSLHELINAMQKICVGHDDTNQDMYNVVQACKNMFLFKQDDGTSKATGTLARLTRPHQPSIRYWLRRS